MHEEPTTVNRSSEIDPAGRAPLDAGLYSDTAAGDPLRDPSLYANRELSQLDFNFRVLAQAMDPQVPLLERYWVWLKGVVLHWNWGEAPKGGPVVDEVGRRIWVSIRLITLGSLLGTLLGVLLGWPVEDVPVPAFVNVAARATRASWRVS